MASPAARAEDSASARSPQDAALAQSLFDEARQLMIDGQFGRACPKLAESERLDPATGTLLNLAVCHEREGKTASAWSEYRDADTLARREGHADRAAYARQHAAALEPKLSRLAIVPAPGEAPDGLEVRLDDATVTYAALGEAVPIDPGDHTIAARAPGKVSWSSNVHVEGALTRVELPRLEDAPAPAPPPPPPPAEPEKPLVPMAPAPEPVFVAQRPPSRTVVYVLAVGGAAALAVGAIAGVRATVEWDDRRKECSGDACSAAGLASDHAARTWAVVSDVGLGAGVAALAGAGVLLLVQHGEPPRAARVYLSPTAQPGGGGVAAIGVW